MNGQLSSTADRKNQLPEPEPLKWTVDFMPSLEITFCVVVVVSLLTWFLLIYWKTEEQQGLF